MVLYPWCYTIVYITLNCALYYTARFELWTLFEDRYYGAMTGCLFAFHKNPTGASGGERNHKVGKRLHSGSGAQWGNHKAAKLVHSGSRTLSGNHKFETGTAISFDLNLFDHQIATTRAPKFCKWLRQHGPESGCEGEVEEGILNKHASGRAAAPSIGVFDEVEGLAVARSSGQSDGLSVGDRGMSKLLTEMDGKCLPSNSCYLLCIRVILLTLKRTKGSTAYNFI